MGVVQMMLVQMGVVHLGVVLGLVQMGWTPAISFVKDDWTTYISTKHITGSFYKLILWPNQTKPVVTKPNQTISIAIPDNPFFSLNTDLRCSYYFAMTGEKWASEQSSDFT